MVIAVYLTDYPFTGGGEVSFMAHPALKQLTRKIVMVQHNIFTAYVIIRLNQDGTVAVVVKGDGLKPRIAAIRLRRSSPKNGSRIICKIILPPFKAKNRRWRVFFT